MRATELVPTSELEEDTTEEEEVEQPQPTRLEQYKAEVREFNRAEKARKANKRAKRKRARASRKINRKR